MNDYRDPDVLCPRAHHRDYNLVGPPGKWTKCYHFDIANGEKNQSDAQKFCQGIQGTQSETETLLMGMFPAIPGLGE